DPAIAEPIPELVHRGHPPDRGLFEDHVTILLQQTPDVDTSRHGVTYREEWSHNQPGYATPIFSAAAASLRSAISASGAMLSPLESRASGSIRTSARATQPRRM